MSVARPEFLALLATVPVAAFFVWLAARRRQRLATAFAGLAGVRGRGLKNTFFLAGLACLALGAAGPRWGSAPAVSAPAERLSLVIALDCSRSMLARDVAPDRLAAAKTLVLNVLSRLPEATVGLVGFAGRAWLACPLTTDRAGLALFLDGLSPEAAPLGGTSVVAALEAARLALAGTTAGAVLLVSDGEETLTARDLGPQAAAVPVVSVAVGGPTPVAVPLGSGQVLRDASGAPVLVGVDASSLARVARASGGRAFRLAPEGPDPVPAIAAALAAFAPPAAAPTPASQPREHSALFYGAALILLLAELSVRPWSRKLGVLLMGCGLALATPARLFAAGPDEFVARGLGAFAVGDDRAALDAFLRARVEAPGSPELLFDVGTASYRLGRFARARELFARAAAGADTPSLRARALYNEGNAAYRLGDVRGAMTCYEAVLALTPDDADARANLDWLRARRPAAGQKDAEKGGRDDPERTGNPQPGGQGQATAPGNAPAPVGRDGGAGREGEKSQEAAVAPGQPDTTGKGRQAVPLAAEKGQKAGMKRAGTVGGAADPILDRVPDLAGLPEAPAYGRPTVEKDW